MWVVLNRCAIITISHFYRQPAHVIIISDNINTGSVASLTVRNSLLGSIYSPIHSLYHSPDMWLHPNARQRRRAGYSARYRQGTARRPSTCPSAASLSSSGAPPSIAGSSFPPPERPARDTFPASPPRTSRQLGRRHSRLKL